MDGACVRVCVWSRGMWVLCMSDRGVVVVNEAPERVDAESVHVYEEEEEEEEEDDDDADAVVVVVVAVGSGCGCGRF